MLRLVIWCAVLTAVSLAVSWVFDNDGLISVEWLGYLVETSVAFVLFLSLGLLLFAILTVEFILWLRRMPGRLSRGIAAIKYEKGLQSVTDGFTALIAGDQKGAHDAAHKTRQYLGADQPLSLILSAQAAQLEGKRGQAKHYFTAMLEHTPTKFMGLKGLLSEAQKEGDSAAALSHAEEAYRANPNAREILPILLNLYKLESKWEEALRLLQQWERKHRFKRGEELELDIRREKGVLHFMQASDVYNQGNIEGALAEVEKSNKLIPRFVPAAVLCARTAMQLDRTRKAASLIERIWKVLPHPELGELYLHLYEEDAKKQLKRAEKLEKLNPNHVESHRVVAIAAIAVGELTKARNHLKMALENQETRSLMQLMLEAEEVDEESSETSIKTWQEKVSAVKENESWGCGVCGHIHAQWQLVCGNCSAVDTINWEVRAVAAPSKQVQEEDAPEVQEQLHEENV